MGAGFGAVGTSVGALFVGVGTVAVGLGVDVGVGVSGANVGTGVAAAGAGVGGIWASEVGELTGDAVVAAPGPRVAVGIVCAVSAGSGAAGVGLGAIVGVAAVVGAWAGVGSEHAASVVRATRRVMVAVRNSFSAGSFLSSLGIHHPFYLFANSFLFLQRSVTQGAGFCRPCLGRHLRCKVAVRGLGGRLATVAVWRLHPVEYRILGDHRVRLPWSTFQ